MGTAVSDVGLRLGREVVVGVEGEIGGTAGVKVELWVGNGTLLLIPQPARKTRIKIREIFVERIFFPLSC